MEDTANWNVVEKAINGIIAKNEEATAKGVIGHSLVAEIYLALKAAGYLKEQY